MWERTSFSHREFCTINGMYPGSWMHKSYGLSTSILQICWLTSQQWTLVWNSANEFKILLCKFPTIQVHWEACDIHVWQWMEHSVHRIRQCRRRWCPIVDVTSTDEKPRISIWTYSREGLLVLCTYWHEENGFENGHQYSSHSRLTRCCMVHEPSSFQNSTSQEFLLATRSLWVQPDCCQTRCSRRRSFGDWWLLASWSTTSWTHQAPQGQEEKSTWDESIRWDFNSKRSTSWWERETHQEFQKSKKKVLYKDNWREERKRFSDQREEFWKGKTIYKIKKDYVIPDDVVRSDLDRAEPFRGNIGDLFHPESASSAPSGVQKKPSSLQKEAGKPISRGPSLKKIEVGPPAAKRHVGKQKPKVVDDSQAGSSRKKVFGSYPKLDEEHELDKRARELGLHKVDSDEPQVIEPNSSAPASVRGKQDSESQTEKLGSDALEPRRVLIPLPGREVQAMTPAYRKMLRKLEDSVELYNFTSNTITCLLLNSDEGLPCWDFLTLFMKSL